MIVAILAYDRGSGGAEGTSTYLGYRVVRIPPHAMGSQGCELRLVNPKLFRLPSNDVVPLQREQAINDILCALQNMGAPLNIFKDFGIQGTCVK